MSKKRASTTEVRGYWREADARRELVALSQSGLSLRQYCRETGIAEAKLRRWKTRIESLDSAQPAFREVRVRRTPTPTPPTAPAGDALVGEVAVGRFIVRVPSGFDEPELARLLAVVSAC